MKITGKKGTIFGPLATLVSLVVFWVGFENYTWEKKHWKFQDFGFPPKNPSTT